MTDLPHYSEIRELSTQIVDAVKHGDTRAEWSLYEKMEKLCRGQHHPFPLEALGDFTSDDVAALAIYEQALGYAEEQALPEYLASLKLAMAERYDSLGDSDKAIELARQANESAKHTDDFELRREISEWLLAATQAQ